MSPDLVTNEVSLYGLLQGLSLGLLNILNTEDVSVDLSEA